MSETNYHAAFKKYVKRNLIYKSKKNEEYYFGEEQNITSKQNYLDFLLHFKTNPFSMNIMTKQSIPVIKFSCKI